MEIAAGTPVYGARGQKVGEISRIVLDGRTQELTHLVVGKGWLLPRDIVVPITAVATMDQQQVRLRLDEDQLDQQPDFIETHYVPPDPNAPLPAAYPPASALYQPVVPAMGLAWNLPSTYLPPGANVETERNVPEGSVALAEGMDVWAGEDKVGTLEGVRIHPRTEHVTHIVISKGLLFPEERLVPAAAIRNVDAQGIHLSTAFSTT